MKLFYCVFTLLLVNFWTGKGAKILGIFPSPGYSQYILVEPLLIALARRGHSVTVISAYETQNITNLNNIVVDVSSNDGAIHDTPLFHLQELSIFKNIVILHGLGLDITEKLLANNRVQALIHSQEKFDLVLVETFFNEAHQVFAKHFDAHQILIASMAINEWNSYLIGNPNIPSYQPTSFAGYTTHMSFKERFRNALALWFDEGYKYLVQYPAQERLVNKYFPKKHTFYDIICNASLMLVCSHVSTSETTPSTASVIEVGGMHIIEKPLPEDIKTFLDSATDGAIFFSMGSNIKSSDLPLELIKAIKIVLGKLKQKVLWKFEDNTLKDVPKNVLISKWFPQSDILAHPNIVLFISHCGMGSATEAVHYGVPVLGIPIYGDQFMNIRRLQSFGAGLELPFKELSGNALATAINKILNNSTYAENANRRRSIIRDRPVKPLDLAVYSIEYVLRHNGARHLRSSIFDLPWYKLYLVDVVSALLGSLFLVILAILTVICKYKRMCYKKTKTE